MQEGALNIGPLCFPAVTHGAAAPGSCPALPQAGGTMGLSWHMYWTILNLQIQGGVHGALSAYREPADQPSGECSFARFSSSKPPDLSAPCPSVLGRNCTRSSSMRLQDKCHFLRSLWYITRSVPAPAWFQWSSGHRIRGADVFSCSQGTLTAELASVYCPSEPASCRISSNIVITRECCQCSNT